MLKILQVRLTQNVNLELPDVQAGFRKGRGTRDQIANIRWIIKKGREFQKNIYFCFIDYAKAFNCLVKNLPEMRETWVLSLDWEASLDEGMATHSSVLAWRIPGMGKPGGLPSMGSHRV